MGSGMGDVIKFKKPRKPRFPKDAPLNPLTKIEYEIKQFLAIRGYHVEYFEIKNSNGKIIVGVALHVD